MGRPLRPCGVPGCATLVAGGGNCPAHTEARRKDPAQARYYGSARWKRLRAMVRQEEPICRECGRKPTKIVDHIDENWRNDARENLRGLCKDCNASHTGRQHRRKQR